MHTDKFVSTLIENYKHKSHIGMFLLHCLGLSLSYLSCKVVSSLLPLSLVRTTSLLGINEASCS